MTNDADSPRADLLGGAGWIAFGLAVVAGAWRMDRFEAMGASLYTMPGLVPGLLGALLVLLGAALAWRGWRARDVSNDRPRGLNRRVATMLVATGIYAVGLVGRVPFWLATFAFVTVFTLLYAPPERPLARRIAVALASGVLTTAAVVVVFEQVFLVRLP